MSNPRKIPYPKKVLATRLPNMFQSLVIFLFTELIIRPIFPLSYTLSVFRLSKVSTITPKQLSIKRCFNVIVLLCTAETVRLQGLMRTLAWTNFKSI